MFPLSKAATRAGVLVVVAAGNSGPGATTIGDYASAPDAITLGAIMNDRSLGNAVTVNGADPYAAVPGDGANPGSIVGGTLFDVATLDPSGLGCSPLPAGSVTGLIVLVARGTCTFAAKINNVAAGGAAGVLIYNNGGYGVRERRPDGGYRHASGPVPRPIVWHGFEGADRGRSEPAGRHSISPAAPAFPARTDVTGFSSRGPNLGSALKPDIVAVGDEIVTGAQKSFTSGESYSASGYIDTAGTSFSAPLAAGAAAVLKGCAARDSRSSNTGRSSSTAPLPRPKDADTAAGVQQAGAGVLNLAAALSGHDRGVSDIAQFRLGRGRRSAARSA